MGVAVSGGGDSMALLLLAADWARARGAALTALTVDHGLRSEAGLESARIADWCAEIGIPHMALTVREPPPQSNIQMWAREQRYRSLLGWAGGEGASLLVAHTLDDQAETVLMRLARGSGVYGLAAMRPATVRDGVRILRPLLGVSRAALRVLLRARDQIWLEDPSNDDLRYGRTRARHALAALAPLGLTAERLARTAESMARVREVLETQCHALTGCAARFGELGEAVLATRPLRDAEQEIGLRVFYEVLRRVSGSVSGPRLDDLSAAFAWLIGTDGPRGRTLHGCALTRLPDGEVLVMRELAACESAILLSVGEDRAWDGRWRVQLEEGSSCQVGALGEAAGKIESDVPAWCGASRAARATAPAFRVGGRIHAVPVAGMRRSGSAIRARAWLARPPSDL